MWFITKMLQINFYPRQCTPLPYVYTTAYKSSIAVRSATAHSGQSLLQHVHCFLFHLIHRLKMGSLFIFGNG